MTTRASAPRRRRARRVAPVLLTLLLGLVAALVPTTPPGAYAVTTAITLANTGFEGSYVPVRTGTGGVAGITGTVAPSWTGTAYGSGPVADFSPVSTSVREGVVAQRVVVSDAGSGAVQLLQSLSSTSTTALVEVTLWVRGTPGLAVSGAVQLTRAPHDQLGQTSLTLGDLWQPLRVVAPVPASTRLTLAVSVTGEGTVDIDAADLQTRPFTVTGRPGPEPIAREDFGQHVNETMSSTLRGGGMEGPYVRAVTASPQVVTGSIAPGWQDNSQTADVTVLYSKDATTRHGGLASQRIALNAVRSGAQEVRQRLVLVSPASYRFDVWVKGENGQRVKAALHRGSAPYKIVSSTSVVTTGAWQRLRFTASLPLGVDSVYLTVGTSDPGVYRLDDVTMTMGDGSPVVARTPGTGYGTVRTWNSAWWATIEPSKGRYDWTVLDRVVADASAAGREVVMTLGQTPDWASTCPERDTLYGMGAACAPTSLALWTSFVSAVATRYGDRIGAYEVWNEPHDPDYGQLDVDTLVALTKATRETLDQVAPSARVIAPAAYSAGWLDAFLAAGGGAWSDVVAVHTYVTPPERAAAALAVVRAVMVDRGATQPIWLTEAATGDVSTDPDTQAALVARQMLVSFGWGADRFLYYTWGTGFAGSGPLVTPGDLQPNAAALAYDRVLQLLVGSTITGATTSSKGVWTVTLQTATGGPGQVVWAPDGDVSIPVPDFGPTVISELDGSSSPVTGTSVVAGPRPRLLT